MGALFATMATAPVEPDPSLVTPGLFGLVMVLALGVAVAFLFRSMNRQIKRVDFPESEVGADDQGTGDEPKATP